MPNIANKGERQLVLTGWPGGLNAYDNPTALPQSQLSNAKNMRIEGQTGYIETRAGQEF